MIKLAQKGYVALITVLIMGAAGLAVGTALLLIGTDSQKGVLASQQSAQARNLAAACVEEALQVMHDTTTFTGTSSPTIGSGGTCTYTVTNLGGSSRRVDTSSTVGTVVRKIQVHVTIGASSISITSWQEVS